MKKIWEELKKLSTMQKGILNAGNFASVFKNHTQFFSEVMTMYDSKDLFDVLDEDNVE